jgi:hypothetical protein
MIILKALVTLADGDGGLLVADVIEHQGKKWIVPTWSEYPTEGYKKPERIICLDSLRHQKGSLLPVDFVVNDPIPKSALYGPDQPAANSGYLVVRQPDVRFQISRRVH